RRSGDPSRAYLGSEEAELTMLTDEQVEAIRAKLGLDKPIPVQYLIYVGNALRGDFGSSYIYQGRPAMELLAERLPATASLAFAALLVATLISLPGGILSALYRNRLPDTRSDERRVGKQC